MNSLNSRSPYESNRNLFLLFCCFIVVWFYMLGARSLVPTDEGRYAEMAREMAVTGDWITLRLNGIKYFEKPPLQNWMNALSFELFGFGDWQARLWTGLCGLLGIGISSYTAFKLYGRRIAIHTALVLASAFYWAGLGHINSLDMGLAGMMTLSLCGLLLAQRDGASENEQRNGMLLCWAGMALATLSKGLIGFVLPGAVLVIYTLWTRQWSLWARLHMGKGLLLFFAITAPWFILIWQKNPEHPYFFFIHEHFQRFTSTVHKRGGPWYYFIPFLVIGLFPWLAMSVQGLFKAATENVAGFQSKKMLFIWAAFIFFFFSISGSKLPSYILPIFPALAILIACELEMVSTPALRFSGALLALVGIAAATLSLTIGTLAKTAFELPLYNAGTPWIIVTAVFALIGAAVVFIYLKKNRDTAILALALSGFLCGQSAFLATDSWGKFSAGIEHVAAINAVLKPETKIYSVGQYEQSLPFYLGRTVTLVEHADEMEFGLEQQPELWISKRADFEKIWRQNADEARMAVAIMRPGVYQDMLKIGLPMRVIGEDPKRVIVTPF